MKRPYLTTKRLGALDDILSERDRHVLHDVRRLRLLTGAQLARLHFGGSESARRLARQSLARLVALRVLMRLGRRIGGVRAGSAGFVYGLDVAGQRLTQPDRRRWWPPNPPGEVFLRHTLAVGQIYVELVTASRVGGFEVRRFDAEPICWRSFFGPGGGHVVLKPDAYVVTAAGGFEDHVFVEVDLATETTVRIGRKAKRYIDYYRSGREEARIGVFPQVVWLVPGEKRREQIVEALGRLEADYWHLFAVHTLDRSVEAITASEVSQSPQNPEAQS